MVKRKTKSADGLYHISGKKYKQVRGSRVQVMNGTAFKTDGTPGLQKKDLLMNKWGRIVSRKKHKTAKREKRLQKHGYFAKKGSFGSEFRGSKSSRKKSGRRRSTRGRRTRGQR